MYEFGLGLMIYDRVIIFEFSKNKKFLFSFYFLSFKGCMYIYIDIVEIVYVIFFIFKMSIVLVLENFFFFLGGCFYFVKLGFLKFLMFLIIFGRFLCFLKLCYLVCFFCILKFRCE